MDYMSIFAIINLIIFSIISGLLLYMIIGWLFLSKYDHFINRQEFYLNSFTKNYKIGYFHKIINASMGVENGSFIIFISGDHNIRFIARTNMWDKIKYRYSGGGVIDIIIRPAFVNNEDLAYDKITCNIVKVKKISTLMSMLGHPIIDSAYMILVDGPIYTELIETDLIYFDASIELNHTSLETVTAV